MKHLDFDFHLVRDQRVGGSNPLYLSLKARVHRSANLCNSVSFWSMSRAQLKVAGGGWVDDTTLQLAQRQAERR
jgi:hypothetical protein